MNLKVFLCESHWPTFEQLTDILEAAGIDYEAADCLVDAQAEIETGRYDVVIMPPRIARVRDGPLDFISWTLIPLIKRANAKTVVVASLAVGDPDIVGDGSDIPDRSFRKRKALSELPPLLRELEKK